MKVFCPKGAIPYPAGEMGMQAALSEVPRRGTTWWCKGRENTQHNARCWAEVLTQFWVRELPQAGNTGQLLKEP